MDLLNRMFKTKKEKLARLKAEEAQRRRKKEQEEKGKTILANVDAILDAEKETKKNNLQKFSKDFTENPNAQLYLFKPEETKHTYIEAMESLSGYKLKNGCAIIIKYVPKNNGNDLLIVSLVEKEIIDEKEYIREDSVETVCRLDRKLAFQGAEYNAKRRKKDNSCSTEYIEEIRKKEIKNGLEEIAENESLGLSDTQKRILGFVADYLKYNLD